MKILGYALVLCVTLLVACVQHDAAWGSEADLKDVVSTLEQGYRALKDVQADFTQRSTLSSIKK